MFLKQANFSLFTHHSLCITLNLNSQNYNNDNNDPYLSRSFIQ